MKHAHPGRLRDALLDATEAAVDRDGVQGVRLADIAAEVGCAISSLYAHFKDREEMVAAAMARAFCRQAARDMEALVNLIAAFRSGAVDVSTALSAALIRPSDRERAEQRWKRVRILSLVRSNPAMMAEVRAAQERLNLQMQEIIRHGQDAGLVSRDLPPRAFALVVQAVPMALLLNDLVEETRVDDAAWSQVVGALLLAFAPPSSTSDGTPGET